MLMCRELLYCFALFTEHHVARGGANNFGSRSTDPLIFWFNGGPGCSSLDGLLNEMGPYLISDDGKTLHRNPHAWNQIASIVYIESPAGVGYSYSTNGIIKTDDDQTARENYAAFKTFFEAFPDFYNHSVYIMGESYGGIYVPTLAALIIRGLKEFPINLKGIAIGNGYVSEVLNIDTSIHFAYSHGLVDEKTWNALQNECCHGCINTCELTNVQEIFQFIWSGNLNPYDLYRDCNSNPELNKARIRVMKFGLTASRLLKSNEPGMEQKPLKSVLAYLRRTSPLSGDAPCLNDSAMIQYMNNAEVRRALHIPENLPKWDVCSDEMATKYDKIYSDMAPFIKEIIKASVQVLLYYGDTDMACNFIMGQQFSASLKLPRRKRKEPWIFDSQIAGFKTMYKGLTFLTVRGAGHMAPQWRAPQMYYVIQQFINNRPF
uniref:Carboxypeptidase n=1 Tax=Loa loa TaxID=7209 RepID=A0A1I7VKP7_LOALO